jgi:Baseplate J-like protein
MPIQLPNLDDRTYNDLVIEGLQLIPTYAPEWTNYNPADPGITLIELFAYITEMLIYRLDRVTDENKLAFLKLINGSDRVVDENKAALLTLINSLDLMTSEHKVTLLNLINSLEKITDENRLTLLKSIVNLDQVTDADRVVISQSINQTDGRTEKSLDEKIQSTIQFARKIDRAITCQDFERLALDAHPQIARAHCIPRINLLTDSQTERPGYISLVVVSSKDVFKDMSEVKEKAKKRELIDVVSDYLDKRRLITTRIIVVEPIELKIKVQAKLVLKPDTIDEIVKKEAIIKLEHFFDPLKGGQTGTGWEFGRSIYISEIYELLDKLSGVDYVEEVIILKQINGNPPWAKVSSQLMEISLRPNELVDLHISLDDITIGGL